MDNRRFRRIRTSSRSMTAWTARTITNTFSAADTSLMKITPGTMSFMIMSIQFLNVRIQYQDVKIWTKSAYKIPLDFARPTARLYAKL